MKRGIYSIVALMACIAGSAQTDVTSQYIFNPDFEIGPLGWNAAGMNLQTNGTYGGTNKYVFMEKWSGTSQAGNASLSQTLYDLPAGSYTLTARAQNVNANKPSQTCTRAYLFAADQRTEVNKDSVYTVDFTTTGEACIGFEAQGATGSWLCVDRFTLTQNATDYVAVASAIDALVQEASSLLDASDAEGADVLQAAIDAAKALDPVGHSETVMPACRSLRHAMNDFRTANAKSAAPLVATHPFVARGATAAFVRLSTSGSVAEAGVCYATHPNPTINDRVSTATVELNGLVYVVGGLHPSSVYYVRAYARTKDYSIGYGDVVKVVTLNRGTTRSVYNRGNEDAAADLRIEDSGMLGMSLWQNLTSIQGYQCTLNWSPGTPSADCSYGGWVRMGANPAYQTTGTVLHESAHGVGVGTHGRWWDTNLHNGTWQGWRATQVVRFLDNNPDARLYGDGMHFWPYGINGSWEDNGTAALYYAQSLVMQALGEDGLPPTGRSGCATPAYCFEQEDTACYYIKSESEKHGLATAYLTCTNTGTLTWKESAEVMDDNHFAWRITFDPKAQMYQLQNVATGRYISTTFKANSTSPANLQLIPGHEEVTAGGMSKRGYWILNHTESDAPPCLTATANGKTGSTNWNLSNNAKQQRWLLLTADEAEMFNARTAAPTDAVSQAKGVIASLRAILATPHADRAEGATATFSAYVDGWEKSLSTITEEGLLAMTGEVKKRLSSFLHDVVVTDVARPFDVTLFVCNPNFLNGKEGWTEPTGNGVVNYGCISYQDQSFEISQTLADMPVGTYAVAVNGFQRPGNIQGVCKAYAAGDTTTTAMLYVNSVVLGQKLFNICGDAKEHLPAAQLQAGKCFMEGRYNNVLIKAVAAGSKEYTAVKLGIKCSTSKPAYWSAFTGFRLYYYGNVDMDAITSIEAPAAETCVGTLQEGTFDLLGRRVHNMPPKGLYIKNQKKVFRK